ncbi:MAG TPA: sigma-70 family RNA polymerase sigma factor [Usitatibacter sp.]|nr:sigma-70 family RNA polymerase sigma factor [Usitatibacter sp.]
MPWINAHAVDVRTGARDWMNRAHAITAAELHERYLKAVFRYVLQRSTSVEEAEDITAEVFAAATTGLSRFRGECAPHLWLLSIARRQIARAHRRKAARRETLASELAAEGAEDPALWEALTAVEGPEAILLRAEARRELFRLIAQLNPDQQEALMLHYMERLPVADIAVVMERSPGAIASLLHRARAALYRQGRGYFLGEDEGQEP